jgi:hypothetical protein
MVTNVVFVYLLHMQTSKTEALTMGTHRRVHSILKGTRAWNFFKYFFCRNRILMVPRACNTRFLKIVFDSAEIFDFLTFPRMLSMRWNRFPVCSACDEISSPYDQCAIKFVPRMLSMDCTCKHVHILPLAEHAPKFVPHMLSMRLNRFRVCSACDKIVSAYAQHTQAIIFEND